MTAHKHMAYVLLQRHEPLLRVLLLAITCLFCFVNLGGDFVADWDEARHGVNGYEIYTSGDWLVTSYQGQPDYFNLKPPLGAWLIAISFHLFGPSVWAMRVPAAVCLLLLSLLLSGFARRRWGKIAGLLTQLFLLAYPPFFIYHMGRQGDADAVFVLLFTGAMLAMLTLGQHPSRLWVCGLCFSFAFLAKSFHALLIPLIGLTYILWLQLYRRFRLRHWLAGAAAGLGPIALWALLRYLRDGTRFFAGMLGRDVWERSTTAMEGHPGTPLFYLRFLLLNTSVLFFILALYGLWRRRKQGRQWGHIAKGLLLWCIAPVAFFTCIPTKLEWYVFPSVVPLLLAGAASAGELLRGARQKLRIAGWLGCAAGALAACVCLFYMLLPKVDAGQSALRALLQETHLPANAVLFVQQDQDPVSGWAGERWRQGMCFLAEAEWSLQARDGGTHSAEKTPGSYLLVKDGFGPAPSSFVKLACKGSYCLYQNTVN